MDRFGVSFSAKQCRAFGIDSSDCLDWLIDKGFRRFRLMSYWDEIEATQGVYDFSELDRQIEQIRNANGTLTLCLGARQPRWPENHWPDWAWETNYQARTEALLHFVELVVARYKDNLTIVSYQLENEALLKQFGKRAEVNRQRLRDEYSAVRLLDPIRPIAMSTSTSWGIPIRKPIPDMVGFSYYQRLYNAKQQRYTTAFHTPVLHRIRAWLIWLLWQRPSFIHELQLEPWGPAAIWEMSLDEQDKSMGPEQIKRNVALGLAVKTPYIDLWGGEWWYWRTVIKGDQTTWESVRQSLAA